MRTIPATALSVALFVSTALSGSACSSEATTPAPPEAAPGCNPIVGDDCLTPFPSAFFERVDATTPTGVRVAIPKGMLPTQSSGVALWPDRLNQKDGFSGASPFWVYFAKGVDPTPLGTWNDPSASLDPSGPVQVIDAATGERVIAFGEVDANALDGERQGLAVHPLRRLTPGHRYVIALVGLHDASNAPLAPAPFRALRDRTTLSASLAAVKDQYDDIFDILARAGVDRTKLSLAWDVTVASDVSATGHLVGMRDQALAMVASGSFGYKIVDKGDTPQDPNLLRRVTATIDVPRFLVDDTGVSNLSFGPDGNPQVTGNTTAKVTINVPRCAETATAPLPVFVFGHGLFGTANATMQTPTLVELGNAWCAILIGTDWIGLSNDDLGNIANVLAKDLNNVYVITDRLQQAHVNAQVMTRLFATKMKDDPLFQTNGHPMTDAKALYYFGVSLGGIQGTTFMALQPDIVRGVLNVPGAEWSLLIPRSKDFAPLSIFLKGALSDPLDRQIAIAASQSEWDYTDPATFGQHLLRDPLPGTPLKRILLQESVADAQVTNVSTRLLGRTIGLPSLDLVEPVPGLTPGQAPLDSAYTQYDSHAVPVPPPSDTALGTDNGAHDAIWQSSLAQAQIHAFLAPDGQVQSVCQGGCNITPAK